MKMKRIIALLLALTLLFSLTAPAFAGNNGKIKSDKPKIQEKFSDMDGYEWGFDDIAKVVTKGIFGGLGYKIFAPGAKITQQEAAVSAVRLIDQESLAYNIALSEVENLITNIPDKDSIATWAKPAVAQLVKLGVIPADKNFNPLSKATRLDIAVLLVKVLGHDADAQAAMTQTLSFRDAHQIPADKIGYVYVATQMKLITGYDDKTFRPNQSVKRIEAALMMGRADYLVDHQNTKVVRGTIKSFDIQAKTVTITKLANGDATYTLTDTADVFIDNVEKQLADLKAGMTAVIRLDEQGKAVLIEAKTNTTQNNTVTGSISAIVPASSQSLALLTINNIAYPVATNAEISINNVSAAFSGLVVGDNATLTIQAGLATKVAVTRTTANTVSGTIASLTPATSGALAIITIGTTAYPAATNAVYTINSSASAFGDLRVGDSATLTITNGIVTTAVVSRTVTTATGTISVLTAATSSSAAKITLTFAELTPPANTAEYTFAASPVIKINGQQAQFGDLKVGDSAVLTLGSGWIDKVEVTRTQTLIEGSIIAIGTPSVGQTYPAGTVLLVTVIYNASGGATTTVYPVLNTTPIFINGQAATYSGIQLGDAVKLTFASDLMIKLEITR